MVQKIESESETEKNGFHRLTHKMFPFLLFHSMAVPQPISANVLYSAYKNKEDTEINKDGKLTAMLKEYKLMDDDKTINSRSLSNLMTAMASDPNKLLTVVGDGLEILSQGKDKKSMDAIPESSGGVPNKENIFYSDSLAMIKSDGDIKNAMDKKSITLDIAAIKDHLENFIKTITWSDESYSKGELVVHKIKDCTMTLAGLIVAGTKILDGLIFMAMHLKPEGANLFKVVEHDAVSEIIGMNRVAAAKNAIQSGVILIYTQGALPTSELGNERNIPNFIKTMIYKNDHVNSSAIAKDLSCVSTRKFPSSVFLDIGMELLPKPVAARCKLNIAGNKAIRYAAFTSSLEARDSFGTADPNDAEMVDRIKKANKKLKRAHEIFDALRELDGNYVAQLRMHPMNPEKPTIAKFTLKLTCAIIFRLSVAGRKELRKKIDGNNIAAYKRDEGIYGTLLDNGDVKWNILDDPEADFMGMGKGSVEATYGMKNK